MTTLLLARHAEPDWASAKTTPGQFESGADPGLTSSGRAQAQKLGLWMAENARPEALYSSTLTRALETAEIVQQHLGLSLQACDWLCEWPHPDRLPDILSNLHASGAIDSPFSSKSFDVLDHRYREFAERIHRGLNELIALHANHRILVVAHGHVIGQAIRSFTDSHHMLFDSDFTGISKFTFEGDRWFVDFINRIDHLNS